MPVSSPPQEMTTTADQTQQPDDETESQPLTDKQREQLYDEDLQAKYRAAHAEQMRRQSCPGCGETGVM